MHQSWEGCSSCDGGVHLWYCTQGASQNERAFVLNGLNASRNLTANHFLSNVT